MLKSINLQEHYLNQIRKENVDVVIYLLNGFQVRGRVIGFDNFTIIIENDGKQQLIYKHAVSTITTAHSVKVNLAEASTSAK